MTHPPSAAPAYQLPSDKTARERQRALDRIGILDTPPEPEFDELVMLASAVCRAPIALVSLLDAERQWFKARLGLERSELPLDQSFCAHAVGTPDEPTLVEDALADERFRSTLLVTDEPNARAYAGVPLVNTAGVPLGTVCVLDTERRQFSSDQVGALRIIARQIAAQLDLRIKVKQLQHLSRTLTASNEQLDQFARIIAHDLLAPIRHQSGYADLLSEEYGGQLPDGAKDYLLQIQAHGTRASGLITDIGTYVQAARHGRSSPERINPWEVIDTAVGANALGRHNRRDEDWPQ